MKIGFVLDDTLDNPNGVQQYVLCLGNWLSEQGHEVHYIVGESTRSDVPNVHSMTRNIRVRFNGNTLSMPRPAPYQRLRSLLEKLQLDVLHVQVPYSPVLGGRLIHIIQENVAVVGTFHILPYSRLARLGSDVLGKINTNTAKRFDAMMAVSNPTQQFAGRYFGFRSVVVANPFYHDQFSIARRGKNKPSTIKKIVFLGRLVPRKGPKELLAAIAELERQKLNSVEYRVVVGGKGSQLEELQVFVKERHLEQKVQFIGFVEEKDKARLLASADILVFPSISGESFGISLLEGMAASKGIVLGGNNLGYASVVASEKQLFDPCDTNSFAQLIARWLQDDTGRERMAKNQQAHVKQFDIDVIGPKIEQIYAHALHNRLKS